jgi:hypothetical protein
MAKKKQKPDEIVEVSELWGGSVRIEFRPASKRNRYTIYDNNEVHKGVPSVTSITSVADFGKSNALSSWAARMAVEVLRQRIKPDEIHGAQFLEEAFNDAQRNFRDIKQTAADNGSLAHAALERHFKEPDSPPPLAGTIIRNLYDSALEWFASHDIKPVAQEAKVYSKKHRFCGTLDGLSYIDGILSLVDYKSSRHVYKPYEMQIAAYSRAYEEEHGCNIEQAWILKIEEEQVVPYKYDRQQLDAAYSAFLALLSVYNWEKSSGKMVVQKKEWWEEL